MASRASVMGNSMFPTPLSNRLRTLEIGTVLVVRVSDFCLHELFRLCSYTERLNNEKTIPVSSNAIILSYTRFRDAANIGANTYHAPREG